MSNINAFILMQPKRKAHNKAKGIHKRNVWAHMYYSYWLDENAHPRYSGSNSRGGPLVILSAAPLIASSYAVYKIIFLYLLFLNCVVYYYIS